MDQYFPTENITHENALQEQTLMLEHPITETTSRFKPHGVQVEALQALNHSREDGASRALIHAATGIGKTFLAAFDSRPYRTILFIAHREEILRQAAKTFSKVRPQDSQGFFIGSEKRTDAQIIFASMQSLGKDEYITDKYFSQDRFDYIVIDEFHHAVTNQYKKIIDYFTPKFVLGLTATPDRMDGRDIYELCHYNVPYQITLQTAINRGLLAPFHYYGIYDNVDYSKISYTRGHYDDQALTDAYLGNGERFNVILKHYLKFPSQRALGFCCSCIHAEAMAKHFNDNGVNSTAVYSGSGNLYSMPRDIAIKKLEQGLINVLFSVDMFNEGVDIPSLDMVMFLRPTESPIVFLQQLGRGLRLSEGKEYLNVLDLVGNYRKAFIAPVILSGERQYTLKSKKNINDIVYPEKCIVDFDIRLIEDFENYKQQLYTVTKTSRQPLTGKVVTQKQSYTARKLILDEFIRIQDYLGKVPTRMELFNSMDEDIYRLCLMHPKENPFKDYLRYRGERQCLTNDERVLACNAGGTFLHFLETTDMTKIYKMPVLNAFWNHGNIRSGVTDQDLLDSWKDFFDKDGNWRDLGKNITFEEYKNINDKQHLRNILKNPVNFLHQSGNKFFNVPDNGPFRITLNDDLNNIVKENAFSQEMHDIILYRTMHYYRSRYHEKQNL